jgi:hypothetical protein
MHVENHAARAAAPREAMQYALKRRVQVAIPVRTSEHSHCTADSKQLHLVGVTCGQYSTCGTQNSLFDGEAEDELRYCCTTRQSAASLDLASMQALLNDAALFDFSGDSRAPTWMPAQTRSSVMHRSRAFSKSSTSTVTSGSLSSPPRIWSTAAYSFHSSCVTVSAQKSGTQELVREVVPKDDATNPQILPHLTPVERAILR